MVTQLSYMSKYYLFRLHKIVPYDCTKNSNFSLSFIYTSLTVLKEYDS